MPVSGFKVGDVVLTPGLKQGVVTAVYTNGSSTARVRTEDGKERTFRQAALRYANQ